METTFETTAGIVGGKAGAGVRTFLGVPYGKTDCDRRFSAAHAVEPWSKIRDAFEFGPSAFQPLIPDADNVLALWGGRAEPEMSESCLTLNVWAPDEIAEPLPVLVYLHGGGHAFGSGSWPAYDGTNLAKRGDVIIVTLNHRLGVFGYLYLDELADERFATSGMNGILDIVEALRWVRRNIAHLGGDPQRVMVFGQSGGGSKVAALLSTPAARGLFHAAAIMSCSGIDLQSPDEASTLAERLLETLRIKPSNIEELLALAPQRVLEAALSVGNPLSSFRPVLDGTSSVMQPLEAVKSDSAQPIPLLIGTTHDEMATFMPPHDGTEVPSDETLIEHVSTLVARPHALLAALRQARPRASTRDLEIAVTSWARMRFGSITLAETQAASQVAPVWMYRFDWKTAVKPHVGLAPHGVDTTFFFDNVEAATITQHGQNRRELARNASSALVALAAHGLPQHEGLPEWTPYDTENRATLLFDTESRLTLNPDNDLRQAWALAAKG